MSQGKRSDLSSSAGPGTGTALTVERASRYMFVAQSSGWGGGSVKLQMMIPTGGYIDVPNSTLTADNMVALDLPSGSYRTVVTTSTGVSAWLFPTTH